MGNCSCTQPQPEQTRPNMEDVDPMVESSASATCSRTSSSHGSGHSFSTDTPANIIVGYDAPNLNIYQCEGSWKTSDLELVDTAIICFDPKSEISHFVPCVMACIESAFDGLRDTRLNDSSAPFPFTLVLSDTESNDLKSLNCLKCEDLAVSHERITKRCLLVKRAIHLKFELPPVARQASPTTPDGVVTSSTTSTTSATSATSGSTSSAVHTAQFAEIEEIEEIGASRIRVAGHTLRRIETETRRDLGRLERMEGVESSMWFYEHETLEAALSKYCGVLGTIPSNVQFSKKLDRDGEILLSGLERIEKIGGGEGLKNDDTLIVMKKFDDERSDFYKEEMIQIYVKNVKNKILAVKVNSFYKVLDVKYRIFQKTGISIDRQTLLFVGKKLADNNTKIIGYFGVWKESKLQLVVSVKV